jgi:hypothetical protein
VAPEEDLSMYLKKVRYLCRSMVIALEVDREAVAWYVCMYVPNKISDLRGAGLSAVPISKVLFPSS